VCKGKRWGGGGGGGSGFTQSVKMVQPCLSLAVTGPGCEEYSVGGGLGYFSCFKYKEMRKLSSHLLWFEFHSSRLIFS